MILHAVIGLVLVDRGTNSIISWIDMEVGLV
jgi:hypothetical protein